MVDDGNSKAIKWVKFLPSDDRLPWSQEYDHEVQCFQWVKHSAEVTRKITETIVTKYVKEKLKWYKQSERNLPRNRKTEGKLPVCFIITELL